MRNSFFVQGKETKRFSHCERVLRKAKRNVRSMIFHSYDDISLFVSFFNIAMSLGDLFQRIATINDRLYLSGLNKLFEEL